MPTNDKDASEATMSTTPSREAGAEAADDSNPFVLSCLYSDGQSCVNAYSTMDRATWNFTEQIIKPHTNEARITIDGGRITLARWRRSER